MINGITGVLGTLFRVINPEEFDFRVTNPEEFDSKNQVDLNNNKLDAIDRGQPEFSRQTMKNWKPRKTKYEDANYRETFLKQRLTDCSARIAADNGLYYADEIGTNAYMVCFYCGIVFSDFSCRDLWFHHAFSSPNCGFLKISVSKDYILGVAEGLNKMGLNLKDESVRLAGFLGWPRCKKQKPKDLVEAGFFYLGEKFCDEVQCFCCGVIISGWDDKDQPLDEHMKASPSCTYPDTLEQSVLIKKTKVSVMQNPHIHVGMLEFQNIDERINSYIGFWSRELEKILPVRYLAKHGLYCTKLYTDNEVRCYCCMATFLSQNLEIDKIWSAHKQQNPECNLVKSYYKREGEYAELEEKIHKQIYVQDKESYYFCRRQVYFKYRVDRLSQLNNNFNHYPHDLTQTCQQLASVGLIYTQLCEFMCHYCKKKFSRWNSNDIPWKKHYDESPECLFINTWIELNVRNLDKTLEDLYTENTSIC